MPAAFDTTGRACRRIPAADLTTRARGRSARRQGPPDPPWELLKGMSAACLLLARTGKRRPLREGARTPLRCPGPCCTGQGRTPRSKAVTPAPRQRAASSLRAHREATRRQHHGGDPPGSSRRRPVFPTATTATRNQPRPARTRAPLRRAFHRGARPAPGQGKARCTSTSTAAEARVTATATTTTTTTTEKATALASQLRVCVALPAPCAGAPMRGRLSARP